MGAVVYLTVAITTSGPCIDCGVEVTMPGDYLTKRREDGKTFYCVNGHPQAFTTTEADKLRKQLALEKEAREAAERRASHEVDRRITAEKGAAIARGKLKAQSQRVQNGVCPCCKRTFQNLMAHMQTKHPDFATKDTEP